MGRDALGWEGTCNDKNAHARASAKEITVVDEYEVVILMMVPTIIVKLIGVPEV